MKLVIAIAHERDRHRFADALSEDGLPFTKLGSSGGFLRQGNVTFLIGVEEDRVARVMDILRAACGTGERFVNVPGEAVAGPVALLGTHPPHPIKVETGGAVAFVVHVETFQQF